MTQFHLDLTEPVDPAGRADHVSPPAPRVSAVTPANGTHTGSILGHAVPGASVAAARAVPGGLTVHERFPALTISTPRLHVRPLTLADAGPVTDVFADRLTQRWLPVSAESGPIDGRTWCGDAAEERRAMGEGDHYGIVRREDDQLIGCLWTKRTDWSAHATEISFALAPHARGFGVAAEAVDGLPIDLIMRHGFARIELRVAAGNTRSRRVAEKAGFHYEGMLRNAGYVHSGRVDLELWSLVAADVR